MKYFYVKTNMSYLERRAFFKNNGIFILKDLQGHTVIIAPFERAEDISILVRSLDGETYCEVTEAKFEDIEDYL